MTIRRWWSPRRTRRTSSTPPAPPAGPRASSCTHRNVANFFAAMDANGWAREPATWLAVTSISFDISVLEILWTLSRGSRVVLHGDRAPAPPCRRPHAAKTTDFCLFFFSSSESARPTDKYRLLLEGARYADRNGFDGRVDAGAALPRLRRPVPQPLRHQRGRRRGHRAGADPRRQRRPPAARPPARGGGVVRGGQPLRRPGGGLVRLRLARQRLRPRAGALHGPQGGDVRGDRGGARPCGAARR